MVLSIYLFSNIYNVYLKFYFVLKFCFLGRLDGIRMFEEKYV